MKYSWCKTVIPIAAIFSFRMLGLFMLIPVFTVYAPKFLGATPLWTGLALGAYGLTQGLLQIPFGMLSDIFGRKSIIALGLGLFALGSLIGAFSESIYALALARMLQGMGAIGSVLIALLSDLTPEHARSKSMAVIGFTIGISFSLAMLCGPSIAKIYGLSGIFYLTMIFGFLGLLLLYKVIPTPKRMPFSGTFNIKMDIGSVLSNRHLQRLNLSIFCQHFILTATFYAVPLLLENQRHQGGLSEVWYFYLSLLLGAFLLMLPILRYAEKRKAMKQVLFGSVFVVCLGQLGLAFFAKDWMIFCVLMLAYFIVFNILEATLPTLVTKQAMPSSKGTAMGIYSSSQFLGIFAGAAFAGCIYPYAGDTGIFFCNALCGLFFLAIVFFMQPDAHFSILSFPFSDEDMQARAGKLKNLSGVNDVALVDSEGLIYLLVNRHLYTEGSAESILGLVDRSQEF